MNNAPGQRPTRALGVTVQMEGHFTAETLRTQRKQFDDFAIW